MREAATMANDKDDDTDDKPGKDKQTANKKAATRKKTIKKSSEVKTPTEKAAPEKNGVAAIEKSTKATSGAAIKSKKTKNDKRTIVAGRRADDKVMPGLLKNLQGVFDKIYSDNTIRDRSHNQIAEEINTNMQRTFLEMHKQNEERANLLETALENIDRAHKNQLMGVKIMSVPVTLLSIVAIVYLFYVVRVMETSMSSMSGDMHVMNAYMETMAANTTALSVNTDKIYGTTFDMTQSVSSMDSQMTTLNKDVDNMMIDLHYMSRSVTPAMNGINRFMP
jgi:hypothetical protein